MNHHSPRAPRGRLLESWFVGLIVARLSASTRACSQAVLCVDRALSGCVESQILETFPTKILDCEVSNRNSYGFGEFYSPRKTKSEPKQLENLRGAAASWAARAQQGPRAISTRPSAAALPKSTPGPEHPRQRARPPTTHASPRITPAQSRQSTDDHACPSHPLRLPLATLPGCATACYLARPLRSLGAPRQPPGLRRRAIINHRPTVA
jgi:hypothetical protein